MNKSEAVEKEAMPIACKKVCIHYSKCVPFVNPVGCTKIELQKDIAESVKHAGYLPVQEVQIEVLEDFEIKQVLAIQALEVLGTGFLKSYTLDDALDGAKRVAKEVVARNKAKGKLYRVRGGEHGS